MLAILRLGAIYVPLDKKNGMMRLVASVGLAKPVAIIVDCWTTNEVANLVETHINSPRIVNITALETVVHAPEIENVARPESTAVILFTSCSTGVPKGIVLPHSCFAAHAEGVERQWAVDDKPQVVLQQITLSFDFSLHQIFTALCSGSTLVVAPPAARGNPAEITKMILDNNVSHTLATPTEYTMWFQAGWDNLSRCTSWKWAVVGGEALPKSTIGDFQKLHRPRLYDFYGPVKATIAITKGEVNVDEVDLGKAVSMGHILPNYSVYILDPDLQPVPVGVPGEITAGGPGVANGYIGLNELTADKFITNRFANERDISRGWEKL